MLTKKHIEASAATIKESGEEYVEAARGQAAGVIYSFMRKVEITDKFDSYRFCDAVGLGVEWVDSFEAAAGR